MWRDPPGEALRGAGDPRARDVAATTPAPRSSTRDGTVRASVRSVAGRAARALRRRRARDRLAAAPRARHPGDRGGARPSRRHARRHHAGRGDPGPGPDRRAAGRPRGRQGHRLRRAVCRSRPSTTCSVTSPRSTSRRSRSSRRSCACSPPAATRCSSTCPPRGELRARRHARRRRGRGVRQGRAAARPALSRAAPALEALARDGDAAALPVPARLRGPGRPRPLVLGPQDGARLRACASSAPARPTPARDLAAGYQAAIVGTLVERAVAALEASGRAPLPSSAASRRTARCAPPSRRPAPSAACGSAWLPPALCVDNAAMIAAAAFRRRRWSRPTTWRSTRTLAARWPGRYTRRSCTLAGS